MGSGIIRDYSEEKRTKLKQQIDQINAEQWCVITDAIGDMWYTAGSWLGFLDIEKYLDRPEEYHKKVMDQHNTTVGDIDRIFAAVADVDRKDGSTLKDICTQLQEAKKGIQKLKELIDPYSMDSFTATKAKSVAEDVSDMMEKANARINTIFDAEIDYAMEHVAENTAWEFVGDVVSLGLDVLSLAGDVLTGNGVAAAADGWQLINDTISTGADLAAGAMLLGCWGLEAFDKGGKDKNKYREKLLEGAEGAHEIEGVAGLAETAGLDGVAKGARAVDTAAAIYGVYQTAKGINDTAKKVNKYKTDGRYNKAARMEEVRLKEVGISTTDVKVTRYEDNAKVAEFADKLNAKDAEKLHKNGQYVSKSVRADQAARAKNMQKSYREVSKAKTAASNVKTVYKLVDGARKGDVGKEMFKNTSGGKLLDKGVKAYNKATDTLNDARDVIGQLFENDDAALVCAN